MYLELTDISKKIGADEVLSGITLSMERGKVYGLQGKNGCGKSMLMRVICGLVLPTVGEVKIDGKILGKEFSFPPSVGVFIEKPGFLDSYSGFQNLMMLASIKGQISGAERIRKGHDTPFPVRRVEIPKPDGEMRKLGINLTM